MLETILGFPARGFRFDCPACGEPWATTLERVIDIHCGTTFHCRDCKARVLFTAEVVDSKEDGEKGGG